MNSADKVITSLFLAVVILASCDSFPATLRTQSTQAVETALAIVETPVATTQTAILSPTLFPEATPLPPTETLIPTSALSFSGTPRAIPLSNGLTWSECIVPINDYARTDSDMEYLATCAEIPTFNEEDEKRRGEYVEREHATNDWRISIGNDNFETRINDISQGCCSYKLAKNGNIILEMFPGFMTSNPNRGFWNIGGKLVWELAGYTQVIVVDGVDYNEKYQLESSHFPYEIKEKLIFIAKQNGKFHIVYDDEIIGPEFDAISMAYCCSMISVYYGSGQYWFVGRRGGTMYVVSIQ